MTVLLSEQGSVTSWGGLGSEANTLLAAMAPASFDLTVTGGTQDITVLSASGPAGRAFLPLRKSWTATLTGFLAGFHGGSVCKIESGGSEYDLHVKSFGLNIAAGVVDTTELGAGSPLDVWKTFRPTIITTTGTITALVDADTALTLPTAFGETGLSTFTVTYKTGHTIAFAGFYSVTNLGVPSNGLQQVTFTIQGSGQVTFSGATTPLFAAGAYGGTPDDSDITLVLSSRAGYTFTGDAFWNAIALNCQEDAATEVVVNATGTGELVINTI